jgi:hypothetical protein
MFFQTKRLDQEMQVRWNSLRLTFQHFDNARFDCLGVGLWIVFFIVGLITRGNWTKTRFDELRCSGNERRGGIRRHNDRGMPDDAKRAEEEIRLVLERRLVANTGSLLVAVTLLNFSMQATSLCTDPINNIGGSYRFRN